MATGTTKESDAEGLWIPAARAFAAQRSMSLDDALDRLRQVNEDAAAASSPPNRGGQRFTQQQMDLGNHAAPIEDEHESQDLTDEPVDDSWADEF